MQSRGRHYESAVTGWLAENGLEFLAVDQSRRGYCPTARTPIKSFDFLVYPYGGNQPLIVEVKGRIFQGLSLAGHAAMECWVTMEDIRGLLQWQHLLADRFGDLEAIFVFAYRFANIYVDPDGHETFWHNNREYCFFAIGLENYIKNMRTRSDQWGTVTLPANAFRQLRQPLKELLFINQDLHEFDNSRINTTGARWTTAGPPPVPDTGRGWS